MNAKTMSELTEANGENGEETSCVTNAAKDFVPSRFYQLRPQLTLFAPVQNPIRSSA